MIESKQIIDSEAYGQIEAESHQIYQLKQGLVGLSHVKQMALLPYADTKFFVLHDTSSQISFVVVPAHELASDYSFTIETYVTELLQSTVEEIIPFVIVNVVEQQPFVNLKAPLLLVPSTQQGYQYVLNNEDYQIRTPLVLKEE